MKALVTVEHAILIAVWNMLSTGELYNDPGPDYFSKLQPAKTRTRASTSSKLLATQSSSKQQADPPDQAEAVPAHAPKRELTAVATLIFVRDCPAWTGDLVHADTKNCRHGARGCGPFAVQPPT
ncbi:hypothetical protein GU243_15555 [Pseudarthrobacter psychrotolerans]|uniref:Uncharacterized protein n=1 Tax=Pseudarthrobacter psychrotolerans TaxID=2697569 RepID=A0A6P1NQ38_9MICC|nr:hypothetical protein GU243_15555 [Pseudarthrobacter psychrotolerans]